MVWSVWEDGGRDAANFSGTISVRCRKFELFACSQGVFRDALSRTESPEAFALQAVQEAIEPQVWNAQSDMLVSF